MVKRDRVWLCKSEQMGQKDENKQTNKILIDFH